MISLHVNLHVDICWFSYIINHTLFFTWSYKIFSSTVENEIFLTWEEEFVVFLHGHVILYISDLWGTDKRIIFSFLWSWSNFIVVITRCTRLLYIYIYFFYIILLMITCKSIETLLNAPSTCILLLLLLLVVYTHSVILVI